MAFIRRAQLPAVLAVAACCYGAPTSIGWNPRAVLNPAFMMMILGWVLGLKVQRFWWDWGVPAFLVWVALELQEHFERHVAFDSVRRLFVTSESPPEFFLDSPATATALDIEPDDRISHARNPDLAGWLPESGGIIYNFRHGRFLHDLL